MPHKAFKLLYSQNFTSKPFNPSSRRNKQQNQECFLSVKKFHITIYCNYYPKKPPILQANEHQNKHNIHINLSNPQFFSYLLITLTPTTKNQTDTNFLKINHPNFQSISPETSLCLNPQNTSDHSTQQATSPAQNPNTKQ